MTDVKMKITERAEGKNPRQIRAMGQLPASIYGKGMEAKSVQLDTHEFGLLYKNNKDAVWELSLGKEKFKAKIQELQLNYATSEFINVEFALV